MRQYISIAVIFLFTLPLFSQEEVQLQGKIFADSLQESSIHIINITQKTGTVNSSSGTFKIVVREKDTLLFSSVQFKNIEILVTAEILDEGFLKITLAEDINELAEVNISNINLTGNLEKDLANIEVVQGLGQILNLSYDQIKDIRFEADVNDPQTAPDNLAYQQNEIIVPGGVGASIDLMAVAGLISSIFKDKE